MSAFFRECCEGSGGWPKKELPGTPAAIVKARARPGAGGLDREAQRLVLPETGTEGRAALRSVVFRRPHFPQHLSEPRLATNGIQKRDDLDSDERIIRILTGPGGTRQRLLDSCRGQHGPSRARRSATWRERDRCRSSAGACPRLALVPCQRMRVRHHRHDVERLR